MIRKLFLIGLLAFSCAAFAQEGEGPLMNDPPKGISVDELIQRFAAKEKEFKQARDSYTYTQDVTVKADCASQGPGSYHEVFDVTFDDRGKRLENVKFAPQSDLQCVQITKEDLDDIRNKLPFVLTSDEIKDYRITYVGQQQEDELHCYVFDIAPVAILPGRRYFDGRIWVDDHDFQIVKSHGKTVPDIRPHGKRGQENLFPAFTTWREQIDGRYWFPTYTRADDILRFSTGEVQITEIVKYTNYKRFGSKVKITYEGQELPQGPQGGQQQPQQTPQPQQNPK